MTGFEAEVHIDEVPVLENPDEMMENGNNGGPGGVQNNNLLLALYAQVSSLRRELQESKNEIAHYAREILIIKNK